MKRFDFSWKCAVCGMHQRKEPHRSLGEHMESEHAMVWSDVQNKYVAKQSHEKQLQAKGEVTE